jgi:hypothetical protein
MMAYLFFFNNPMPSKVEIRDVINKNTYNLGIFGYIPGNNPFWIPIDPKNVVIPIQSSIKAIIL